MDYSCIDDSSTTSESLSTETAMIRLYRMGSGGSSFVLNGVEPESRKLPSSKYKGVVPQPNGRWGAQIYEKHKRVWLGTFNEEEEAATSYDIAARRFRGHDAVTNFKSPMTGIGDQNDVESDFIASHSKAEIVDMLRRHTYADELEQSKRKNLNGNGLETMMMSNDGVLRKREVLFEKALTPSDVGKLNRLVIPKQYAEKHFPLHTEMMSSKGVLMNVKDGTGKVWRFRYCYWRSSQSYVLTKGWSRFIKDRNLRRGDVVCFERSIGPDRQLYIDWKVRSGLVQNVVRLFGVNIVNDKSNDVGVECAGKKRSREVDLFSLGCSKKQLIINAL